MILAAVVIPLGGSLVVAVGRAAHRGMLAANAIAGSRTSAIGGSEEAWYVAHAAGRRWISWEEGVIAVTGMLLRMVAN